MKHIFLLAFVLCSLMISSKADAQFWQQTNGPGGADIKAVAINSQGHIFVASNSLLRSLDNGASWQQIATEIHNYTFANILVKPSGELFVLSFDTSIAKVWRSTDNGNSWSLLHKKIRQDLYWSMNITPVGTIYLVLGGVCDRSTDNGNSWVTLNPNVVGNVSSVWSDKAGTLFLSTSLYCYRSTDNGQNWSKIVNGLTTGITAFGETSNGDLYAGVRGFGGDIIYKSTDGGRVWVNVPLHMNYLIDENSVNRILISPQNRIVASINDNITAISDDGGNNWRRTPALPSFYQYPNLYETMAMNSSGMFCLHSYSSFLFLSNLDSNAIPVHFDVPNGKVTSLLKYNDGNLLSDIWRSSDQGMHWTTNSTGGIMPANAIDSSQNILIGNNGFILRSTDWGITWKQNSTSLTQGAITAIDVRHSGEIFASSSEEGIFRSSDNGLTWDQLNAGITDQHLFSLAVHQNGDVYAGGKNMIYRSTDVGLTWQQLTTNFPAKGGNITAMVVSTQGNIIAGIDNAGVYWSTDNGTTWSQKALGLTATKINALVSTPSGKVFAGTDSGVFFLDITPGANWLKFNQGLTATNVLSLCRDQSGRIFAGTDVCGIFSSLQTYNIAHPGGSLNTPLLLTPADNSSNVTDSVQFIWNAVTNATMYQISISPSPDFSTLVGGWNYVTDTTLVYHYTGTKATFYWRVQAIGNDGASLFSDVWNFTMNVPNDVNGAHSSISSATLGTNYPNPFSASTTIPFTIGEQGFITLEVLDPLGRNCAVLASGNYTSGNHEAKFDGEHFASGTYVLRLQTEKETLTKMIEIIK